METYTFRRPDNGHAHLREDELLGLIYHHFNIYGRVVCIGNLKRFIENADEALGYQQNIIEAGAKFEPVMCLMLTRNTTVEMIYEAARKGIKIVKFIPGGTSFGASEGVRLDEYYFLFPLFEAIADAGMHLMIHAELISLSGRKIHLLKREERALPMIAVYHRQFPKLKMTICHVSTAKMIDFIRRKDNPNLRGELTPQHGILTYQDVFDEEESRINPLNFCLPVAKLESDRLAVRRAMVESDGLFFYATDIAVHLYSKKMSPTPTPGVFFGKYEYLRTLEIFEEENALDKFEDFTSRFWAEYYDYPLNEGKITVAREDFVQPTGDNGIKYCMGGENLKFHFVEEL